MITKSLARRLHNFPTNWDTYRQIIQGNEKLSTKRKELEEIETEPPT